MNHFRLLAIETMLMFALICPAQQTAATPGATDRQEQGQTVPQSTDPVDQHLRTLSEKLDLSADQQREIRPILQHMLDARQRLIQDSSLSNEAREETERTLHEKASKQARKFLNDDQKKKLDRLEQEPHHDSHGNGEGKAITATITTKLKAGGPFKLVFLA